MLRFLQRHFPLPTKNERMTTAGDIPVSQDDLIARAWTRLRKGDFQGARELSTTLLAAGTNHSPAFFILGAVAFENDDLDGAVDYLERAIEADPGAIECYEYFEMVLNAALSYRQCASRSRTRAAGAVIQCQIRHVAERSATLPAHGRRLARVQLHEFPA